MSKTPEQKARAREAQARYYARNREREQARARRDYAENREQRLARQRAYREENREERNRKDRERYHIRSRAKVLQRYGLTEKDFDSMMSDQDGRCAICHTEPEVGFLKVDHDHETEKVRGLLCNPCNLGLGYMRDDTARLRRAASYLEEYQT